MRRFLLLSGLGFVSTLLAGCPIYSGDGTGDTVCLDCSTSSGTTCATAEDCPAGETCGVDHQCIPFDGGGGSTTGTGGTGTGGAGGGPSVVWCGHPGDCLASETCAPDGTCQPGGCDVSGCIFGYVCDGSSNTCTAENPASCGSDTDCSGFGSAYRCVSGNCTAPQDQCFDQTQCPSGDVCADGKCVQSCQNGETCNAAYTCDASVGLCDDAAQGCVITNDCGSGALVCVDGACVPRSDGASCPTGTVWVRNGCVPDQKALFVCSVDGLQDACAGGSICLHHSCYISCEAPNQGACTALAQFNQCKSVTTPSGDHQVCGSSDNLGSECDPTAGTSCTIGLVCIDGFCK